LDPAVDYDRGLIEGYDVLIADLEFLLDRAIPHFMAEAQGNGSTE
jgi:hypothetical protein